MRRYLSGLQDHYDFKVLDCLRISTFGGSPDGFYDGAHLTAGNSRRLLRYCISKAPSCFRVPMPAPSPSPSSSSSSSPSASLVSAPAYTPVSGDMSTPADFIE